MLFDEADADRAGGGAGIGPARTGGGPSSVEFGEPDDDAAYEHYRGLPCERCEEAPRDALAGGRSPNLPGGRNGSRSWTRCRVREGHRRPPPRSCSPAEMGDPAPVPERAVVRLVVRARALGALERQVGASEAAG